MEQKSNHYVYMLKCSDQTLYTGYTTDINRRIAMHERGKGAKYTRGREPFELVYAEEFSTKVLAMRKEYQIKRLSRAKKETLMKAFEERKKSIERSE